MMGNSLAPQTRSQTQMNTRRGFFLSREAWLVLGLLALTALIYSRSLWEGHEFLLFDDNLYVTANQATLEGPSARNIKAVFDPNHRVAANYHPLTEISHMVDGRLYGLTRPWGHHLTNILFHLANTALCYVALRRMTGSFGPSLLVAALFALHPMHVESVAWISERKDVLSAFFWFLGLVFYERYARGSGWYFVGVFLCMLLGILSKPMMVTFPCVLLLLDFWPLGRLSGAPWSAEWRTTAQRLVLEKLPLFALTVFSCLMTMRAQRAGGAVSTMETLPLLPRVWNALYSYNAYLFKAIWPTGLAVPYPFTRELALETAIMGGLGFLIVTYLAWNSRKKYPFLTVGWLWYVGTLVPVIGLVQVGNQAMADRYTYIPFTGLFIALAWGLADLCKDSVAIRRVVVAGSAAAVLLLAAMSFVQIGYWRNTVTLFSRTIEIFPDHYLGHYGRSTGLLVQGDLKGALASAQEAVKLHPDGAAGWHNQGYLQLRLGDLNKAAESYRQAVKLSSGTTSYAVDLAWVEYDLGNLDDAERRFDQIISRGGNPYRAMLGRGAVALKKGQTDIALRKFLAARKLAPNDSACYIMLARIMAGTPDPKLRQPREALRVAEWICANSRQVRPYWLDTLAAAYAANDRFDEAAAIAQKARDLAKAHKDSALAGEIEKRRELYLQRQPLREDSREVSFEDIFEREQFKLAVQPG